MRSPVLIVCAVLALGGCTASKQPAKRAPAPPVPALAAGLKDVLGMAIPASDVMVRDLKSVNVDLAGHLAAVSYPPGHVSIWDLAQRTKVSEIVVNQGTGRIALSPDGQLLAISDSDELAIWELSSKRRVASFKGQHFGFQFSRRGDRVVVGGFDGITILDAHNGNQVRLPHDELAPLLPPSEADDTDVVSQVYFADDDSTIVASSFSYWLTWRPGQKPTVVAPDYGIRSTAMSPDRRQLILVADLGLFRWDIATRKQVGVSELPGGDINLMGGEAFDASGTHFVIVRQERAALDPINTHTRVVNHIESYRLPDMVKVWSATVTHFEGPYTPGSSTAGPTSGDLVVITAGNEHLVLRDDNGKFSLLTGPATAQCPPDLLCREGFAFGRKDEQSVLYQWMYGQWRPAVHGQTSHGTLTAPDLEAEGLYGPYFAKLFPEAAIVLPYPQ